MRYQRLSGILLASLLAAACGSSGSGEVIVLNPGDGLPVESFEGMDLADLNNDGLVDIVAASHYFDGADFSEDRLNVFLQDAGNPGTFLPRSFVVHQEGANIWQVVAADLTLDGNPEILLKSIDFDGFALFEQDPANPGQFLVARRFGTASGFRPGSGAALAVGDIDGDLYPDVVATAAEDAFLFRQDPTSPGQFAARTRIGEGVGKTTIGDLDGDGLNDVVTFATHLTNDGLRVKDTWHYHRQNSSSPGAFFAPVAFLFDAVGWALGAADLNNDGRLDIAVNSSRRDNEFLDVYLQSAFGDFIRQSPVATSLNGILGEQAIADLDGDGRPEIIAAMNTAALDPQLIQIYSQDATGAYQPDTLLTIPYPEVGQPFLYAVHVTDVDGDGQPDIVVSTGEIFIFFQRTGSPGTFLPATRVAAQR